jgi:hypothetical protein
MSEIYNRLDEIQDLDKLKQIIKLLLEEKNDLEIKVKNYTNPERHKIYYEKNKEMLIQKSNERNANLPKEKKNEYQRNWYKRKKEKEREAKNIILK